LKFLENADQVEVLAKALFSILDKHNVEILTVIAFAG